MDAQEANQRSILQDLRKTDAQFNSKYQSLLSGGLVNVPAVMASLINENNVLKQESGRLDAEASQMRRDLDALLAGRGLHARGGVLNQSVNTQATTLDLLARSPEYLRTQCEMLLEHKKHNLRTMYKP